MNRSILVFFSLWLLALVVPAWGDTSGVGGIAPEDDYNCFREDDGRIYCACVGSKSCDLMQAEDVCNREVAGGGTTNDTECFDEAEFPGTPQVCVCRATRTTGPVSRRPEALSTSEVATSRPAPRRDDEIVSPNNRAVDRPSEVVRARRGTAGPSTDDSRRIEDVQDGTSNTLNARRSATSLLEVAEKVVAALDEPDTVAIRSDAAPPEVTGTGGGRRRGEVDHRDSSTPGREAPVDHRDRGGVTDHRDGATDPRESGRSTDHRTRPAPRPRTDTKDEDPAEPSDHPTALKGGLGTPTDLAFEDVSRTSLTLVWQDRSTHEFGVEVYRADPMEARRDPENAWQLVGLFEERVDSRVDGMGMRSETDDGLLPDTGYCYRLRAYGGFDRAMVSLYSKIACVETAP